MFQGKILEIPALAKGKDAGSIKLLRRQLNSARAKDLKNLGDVELDINTRFSLHEGKVVASDKLYPLYLDAMVNQMAQLHTAFANHILHRTIKSRQANGENISNLKDYTVHNMLVHPSQIDKKYGQGSIKTKDLNMMARKAGTTVKKVSSLKYPSRIYTVCACPMPGLAGGTRTSVRWMAKNSATELPDEGAVVG